MIEILHATTDHGRSQHVTIVKSEAGKRERLTSFICTAVDWLDFWTAIKHDGVQIRQDDYYARLDRGLHS